MIRSTCAPTMMQGSDQLNVMPRRPHIDLDCRILPGTGPVALTEMLTEIINDKDVQIQANCEIPVLAEMGLPVTPANGPQWHFVKNSIRWAGFQQKYRIATVLWSLSVHNSISDIACMHSLCCVLNAALCSGIVELVTFCSNVFAVKNYDCLFMTLS